MQTNQILVVGMQINFLVGDIRGNCEKMMRAMQDHAEANIIVFSELSITAYPPEDLLFRKGTYQHVQQGIDSIIAASSDAFVIFGAPVREEGQLYNAAIVARNGKHVLTYYKQCLPNYGVFDEYRYFSAGNKAGVFECSGVQIGVTVCEDIWQPGPAEMARHAGAKLLINLNASPYHQFKWQERERRVIDRCQETSLPIIYVNQLGGQDELLFDGDSFAVNKHAEVTHRAGFCIEDALAIKFDCEQEDIIANSSMKPRPELTEAVYQAIVLSVKDYIQKNGFKGAIIGLSGGIDSALTLAIAVDALGADHVQAVMMPSQYTSQMSLEDAKSEAELLGVEYITIPIQEPFEVVRKTLQPIFSNTKSGTTEENIQARLRGLFLMALSNKFGKLVLSTGNKSEMAVGYATLYGDMAGGFAPLKDVPKMQVYALSRYRNTLSRVIPERVISRPPSAELAPDQKDQDSLPPYDLLDALIERIVEQDQTYVEIVEAGFDPKTVERVMRMIFQNEYKRRQAAPGVKITRRAFGKDRRYPITTGTIRNIFD